MSSTFGRRRCNEHWVSQLPGTLVPSGPITEPSPVYNDRSARCIGCPYPKHGYTCYSSADGRCIRTDMERVCRKKN